MWPVIEIVTVAQLMNPQQCHSSNMIYWVASYCSKLDPFALVMVILDLWQVLKSDSRPAEPHIPGELVYHIIDWLYYNWCDPESDPFVILLATTLWLQYWLMSNDRLSNLIDVQHHVWPLDVYACPSINVQHTVDGAKWPLVCMRARLWVGWRLTAALWQHTHNIMYCREIQ